MKLVTSNTFFLVLLVLGLFALIANVSAVTSQSYLTWEIPSSELSLTIDVNRHPNVNDVKDININVKENGVLVKNAHSHGKMYLPDGDWNFFDFTNMNDGNYSNVYAFDLNGTYVLDANAIVDANGASGDVNGYIYVGTYALYISFTGDTSYDQGDAGTLMVYVQDENSNPILYAGNSPPGYVTIYYPSGSVFVEDQELTEQGLGYYYYNFTVPNTAGTYTYTAQINSGTNTDSDSGSFEVSATAPSCGDGTCNGTETCSTCSADCGQCDTGGGSGGGGGGGGSGGKASLYLIFDRKCVSENVVVQMFNRFDNLVEGGQVILRRSIGDLITKTTDSEGKAYFYFDETGSFDIWGTHQGMTTLMYRLNIVECQEIIKKEPELFSVEPEIISVELKQGQELSRFIKVTNNSSETISVNADLSDLQDFVIYVGGVANIKFELEPEESQSFELRFDISEDTVPELYTKKIIIRSGGVKKIINVVFNISSKGALFDVGITIPQQYNVSAPGDLIPVSITLYNLGSQGRVDALLTHSIRDFEGNEYFSASDSLAVETQASFIKEFYVPEDISAGKYIIFVEAEYNGSVANATHIFEISTERSTIFDEFENLSESIKILFIAVVGIMAFFLLMTLNSLNEIRKHHEKEEKYHQKKKKVAGKIKESLENEMHEGKEEVSEEEKLADAEGNKVEAHKAEIAEMKEKVKEAEERIKKRTEEFKKEEKEEVRESMDKEIKENRIPEEETELLSAKEIKEYMAELEKAYEAKVVNKEEYKEKKELIQKAIEKYRETEKAIKMDEKKLEKMKSVEKKLIEHLKELEKYYSEGLVTKEELETRAGKVSESIRKITEKAEKLREMKKHYKKLSLPK